LYGVPPLAKGVRGNSNKAGQSIGDDISQTDDLLNQIQDQSDEIRDLLFDLEESE